MVEIKRIIPGSPAEKAGLEAGLTIKSINGSKIRDYIDYLGEISTCPRLKMEICRPETEDCWMVYLNREAGSGLGLELEGIVYDGLKKCCNNCIFCFVDQQPNKVRESQKIKDDDYRFSFLQGSFITLTNLTGEDYQRIVKERLSPLYISVHTTNPALRAEMMGNQEAGSIMEDLRFLADNEIAFHLQLVVIPGYNDGRELMRTFNDLAGLEESVLSLGVVPVGLTSHRHNLPELESFTPRQASRVLEIVENWQQKNQETWLADSIFLADEFFLMTGKKIPDDDYYRDYPQLENGIGLTRLLRENYRRLRQNYPESLKVRKSLALVTGALGKQALEPVTEDLKRISGLEVEVIPVVNRFLGEQVTVTGLLSGEDIIKSLQQQDISADLVVLPEIIFNEAGMTLDGYDRAEIREALAEKEIKFCQGPGELLEVVFDDKAGCSNSWQAECRQIDAL